MTGGGLRFFDKLRMTGEEGFRFFDRLRMSGGRVQDDRGGRLGFFDRLRMTGVGGSDPSTGSE